MFDCRKHIQAYRTRPEMESVCSFGGWWVSPTHPVLESVRSFVGWEVFVTRQVRGLSYTPLAGICYSAGGQFDSHAPC